MTDSFAELWKRAFVDVVRNGGKSNRIQRFLLPPLISMWPGMLQGVLPNISADRMLDMNHRQTRVALNVSFLPTTCDVYTELSNLLLAFFQGGAHLDLTDPGHSATLHSLFAVWIFQKNVAFPLITLYQFLQLCLTGELASGSSLESTISVYVEALRAELTYVKREIEIQLPGDAEPRKYRWTTMTSVWAKMPLKDVLSTFAFQRRVTSLLNFAPNDLVRQWVMQNVPAANYNPDEIPNRSSDWTADLSHTVFHLHGIVNIIASYLVKPLPQYPVVVFPPARTPKETEYYAPVLFHNTECFFVYSPRANDAKVVRSVCGALSLVTVTKQHVKFADYTLGKTIPDLVPLGRGVPFGRYSRVDVFGTAGNALRLPAAQLVSSTLVIIRPYGQRISLEQVLEWFVSNAVICVCVVVWGDPSDSMPTGDDWQESCHKICTVLPLCDLLRKVEPLQPEGKNVPVLQPNSRIKVVPTSSTGKIKDPNGPWYLNWREFHMKCTVVYDEDDDKAQKKTSCKRKQPGD